MLCNRSQKHKQTYFSYAVLIPAIFFVTFLFFLVRFFGTGMKGSLRENQVLAQTPTTPESATKKSSYLLNLLLAPIKDGDLQSRN